jgi:hypothetical protein
VRTRFRLKIAASGLIGLAVFGVSLGGSRADNLSEIVALVETKGWKADLGSLCSEFKLPLRGQDCIFRQISVQEVEGRGDPRGFNAPRSVVQGQQPLILIFHLGPLVGEFFLSLTPTGELLKAFYRAKGRGYDELPLDEVREEFERDLQYWLQNVSRVRSGLRAQ